MVKRLFILLIVPLVASLFLVACSSAPSSPTPTSSASTSITTSSAPTKPATSTTTAAPATTATVTTAQPNTVAPATSKPSTSTSTGQQQYGGILRIITTGSPLSFGDPTLLQDSASIMEAVCSLETLVNTDNSGVYHGVLATDWTIAPDGLSITFKLRKGVKFQDGTDFNAAAVKFNLDRYYQVFKTSTPTNQWNGIDVIDDYTVRVNLKSFMNTILGQFDGSAGMMVSPTAFQKNGADWAKMNPVGTGPYILKSFSRDVSAEFSRFDGYWGGKPFLDGIKFFTIVDATTSQVFFQSGGAEVVLSPNDSVTNDLIKKGYILEKRPGPLMALIPDSKHPTSPFADLKVRQAISYAIDRKGIANTLGYGLWEVANQPAAAYQFGHIDNVPYTYDVAKAKQLMKDSGFPNGIKTSVIASTSFGRDALVAIQSQLAAIGITMEIKMVEMAAWNEYVNKGWDNSLLWGTHGMTFTNYVSTLTMYFSSTATRYPVLARPNGLDDLINKALATPDYNTEKALCQQAVRLLVDNCTEIPVYITPASYLLTDKIHDTHFDSLAGSGFRWSVPTAWLSK